MTKKVYKYLFVIWSIILFTLTSLPSLALPTKNEIGIDKLAHLIFYFIFAFLFVKSQQNAKIATRKLLYLTAFIPLFDELHQIPISGRYFSFGDILADVVGMLIIFFLFRKD
ncbi:MAG: VanZ family protein [Candidatus Cloacimonetes bacterium]|jgi:VanZ family protein|nr:VanZ family protein [Candidatus Cloacimonadota bacterium]MBT6993648.1 VanZ family protein [Candidatus Cloacimonadota bacterium]MBT7470269.1 VanZ family protein [Candidatus Cloacimonadota bacterium]